MKQILKPLAAFLAVLTLAACGPKETTLLIVHTSDTHSAVVPDTKTGMGGYERRAVLIDSLRRNVDKDLLLFDCGDYSQGSLFYTLFKGETEVRLMNGMGYDAATIGNHEFDNGEENMQRLFTLAQFPTLCCNYGMTGTPLEECVKPYTVLERKGLRIGVFGLGAPMAGLVLEKNYEGMTMLNTIAESQKVIDTLRGKERCDVVVCLSHLGWQVPDEKIDDVRLIAGTQGIDLVLGGHSHSNFDEPQFYANAVGDSIPLMHVGGKGEYVGCLELTVKR